MILEGLADEIGDTASEDRLDGVIEGRTDIGSTTKEQLIRARRGQGIFRANVRLNEKFCRVTGVSNPNFLRASHIKPWKDSSDEEKLSGCNGLLRPFLREFLIQSTYDLPRLTSEDSDSGVDSR